MLEFFQNFHDVVGIDCMNVLFVCKGNVGRSQMAEAIFNSLADGRATASSAGANPGENEGKKIADLGPIVVSCMKDINLNVSDNMSKAITKNMFDKADIVVSLVNKSELPEYVQKSGKVIFWDIENPKGMDYEDTARIRNMIYKNVAELVEKIKSQNPKKAMHSYK